MGETLPVQSFCDFLHGSVESNGPVFLSKTECLFAPVRL